MKKVLCILALILFVTACGGGNDVPKYNYVRIIMETGEEIVIRLYHEHAPVTVENFIDLVERNFYDGSEFHRVIEGFMIQGGISANGEMADTIVGEFASNGIENSLRHERGVISMARTMMSRDSASSQFFIMHESNRGLDGEYAAFGRVVIGMEVVDRIATVEVAPNPAMGGEPGPIEPERIRTMELLENIPEERQTRES